MKLGQFTRNIRSKILDESYNLSPDIYQIMKPDDYYEPSYSSDGSIINVGLNGRFLQVNQPQPILGHFDIVDFIIIDPDHPDYKESLIISTPPLIHYPAAAVARICVAWLSKEKDAEAILDQLNKVDWGPVDHDLIEPIQI